MQLSIPSYSLEFVGSCLACLTMLRTWLLKDPCDTNLSWLHLLPIEPLPGAAVIGFVAEMHPQTGSFVVNITARNGVEWFERRCKISAITSEDQTGGDAQVALVVTALKGDSRESKTKHKEKWLSLKAIGLVLYGLVKAIDLGFPRSPCSLVPYYLKQFHSRENKSFYSLL